VSGRPAVAFERLVEHPGVLHLVRGDPRFTHVLDESTRRAMRALHAGQPLPRGCDTAALMPAATAAVRLLDRIATDPLEVQVVELIRGLVPPGSPATARILDVTGWGGGAPMTIAEVATRHGVGRESVALARRQILGRLPRRPWLPALDAAGALLSCLAPAHGDVAARQLREVGISDRLYSPAALLDLPSGWGSGGSLRWSTPAPAALSLPGTTRRGCDVPSRPGCGFARR